MIHLQLEDGGDARPIDHYCTRAHPKKWKECNGAPEKIEKIQRDTSPNRGNYKGAPEKKMKSTREHPKKCVLIIITLILYHYCTRAQLKTWKEFKGCTRKNRKDAK